MLTVTFKRLNALAAVPRPAHPGDAGMDLQACEQLVLAAGARALVRTGLSVEMPSGLEAQVRPRSGLALKHGVTVLNAPGTIDAGYRGEIGVILVNHGAEPFMIEPGMRIAQIVFAQVAQVEVATAETLSGSARGEGGFGSTGR
ncbi:MAG: dUTP diphosphatase [Kiritimatiellae bacterium]|nr:dUTP diphosphatase [Kiritimatiellia bacterium]